MCDATTRTADAAAVTCIAKAGYFGAAAATTAAATGCPTGSTGPAAPSTVTTTNAVCTQLAAGYSIANSAASGSAPTACPAGSYCTGAAVATPTIAAGVLSAAAAANGAFGATACPAGTTNALTGSTSVGALAVDATVCDDLAPGYAILSIISAQSGAGLITALTTGITACAAGYYCPGKALGVNAITAGTTASTFTWTQVAAIATGNAATGAPQACPPGFTNVLTGAAAQGVNAKDPSSCKDIAAGYTIIGTGIPLGSSVSAGTLTTSATTGSIASPFLATTNGVSVCPVGSFCVGQAGAIAFTGTGPYSWAAVSTSTSIIACPTGTTGTVTTSVSAVLACTDLAAGYAILANIAAQSSVGAVTSLTTGITQCAVGFYCLCKTAIIPITAGTTGSTFTWTAITAPAAGTTTGAPQACTAGFGLSTASSSAVSAATGCNAVAPGYSIPATTAATASITPAQCAAGSNCLGLSTATGITFSANGISSAAASVTAGSTACPVSITSAAGATTSTGATGCNLVMPGYFVDASDPNCAHSGCEACQVGEYCPGNGGLYLNAAGTATATASVVVGTPGGEYNCPAGSATPGTVASATNNALVDCNLQPNFYIPSTATGVALYVPVSCPAGSHCPGGTAIGTAGGALVCPTGSTIPACTATSTTTNVAAPSVTVAAGVAPAVTVAAGAAPVVNVTVAAPVSAAPRTVAHALVLALTAMAALAAF